MHEEATVRHLRFIQVAQELHAILILLSVLPVLIFVRSNDDIRLTASDIVSHFIPC